VHNHLNQEPTQYIRWKRNNTPNLFDDMPFDEVHSTPLYNSNGVRAENHKAIENTHTGKIISVVGKNYKLVPNSTIIPQFERAIINSNLNTDGIKRDITQSHGNARTVVKYTFPEHTISIKDNDDLQLQIAVLNSYDGSWTFRSMVGAFRMLCLNGMVIGNSFATYKKRHSKSLDIDLATDHLRKALGIYMQTMHVWKDYPKTIISTDKVNIIFNKIAGDNKLLYKRLSHNFLNYVSQDGATLWSVLNALTDWATHAKVKNEKNKANVILLREEKVRAILPMLEEVRRAA